MKEKYYKVISIKKMFKILKNNIVSILCFTLAFLGCGSFYDLQIKGRTYQTSATVFNKTSITTTNLYSFTVAFKSDLVIDRTVESLKEKEIVHKNGSFITHDEIYNNTIIPTSNNSTYLVLSYRGKEKSILQSTFSIMLDIAIDYLKNETGRAEFAGFSVFNEPSTPTDISHFKQNMIIYALFGLFVSYCVSFIVDYKYDLVCGIDDVIDLNTNVMELNYTERKK